MKNDNLGCAAHHVAIGIPSLHDAAGVIRDRLDIWIPGDYGCDKLCEGKQSWQSFKGLKSWGR